SRTHDLDRGAGGVLFGFFFGGPGGHREHALADADLDLEDLGMVVAVRLEQVVARRLAMAGLDKLLQARLVVGGRRQLALPALEQRGEEVPHDRINRVEPAIEVDRGDERLEGAREDRGLAVAARLRLALAET